MTTTLEQDHNDGKHRTKIVDGCPLCEANLIGLDEDLRLDRGRS